jgi:class 3 adenylate cyclase/predicted ATPase
MNPEHLVFGPFRFDPVALQLWRNEQVVAVQPKPLAVLRALATRPGQVVTKRELLKDVWAGTYVTQAVLKVAIRALREALGESAEASNYVETVGREGYRFLGVLQPRRLSESPLTSVPPRELERKLVAILSADVQGYSRLMGEDELTTIRTLTVYREIMTTLITQHRGRVVDAPGDNLLAEFASAVDAVEAAVAIQHDLTRRNADLPPQRQMHYRIGINVGDVVVEGERLYGDGVNLAARLEALAEGGGICLSRSVYEQVRNKVALTYEYGGERRVKNIAEPVAVYRVLLASPPASAPVSSSQFPVQSQHSAPLPIPRSLTPGFVGRDVELGHLHELLDKALRGEPQFVFITGEPGIGKTAVVDRFREQVRARGSITVGDGQCVEQYGQGEAYLPVLEALGRLCREAGGERLVALLRQYAPTWLVQLPGVVKEEELQALQLQVQGATQQRMLREIAEAIEVGTVRRPLMLVVEDLHWSDSATIELLAYLAKRRQPMRLLVVATYRPVDVVMGAHPLKTVKQDLQAHGLCEEIRLELLKKQEIEAYVGGRFPESDVANVLAPEVYRRTEGNPLFMVNVVEHLLTQGLIRQENGRWAVRGEVEHLRIPETLRQLIGQQVERLSEEQQQVLEGASVAGAEFPVAAVVAVVRPGIEEVETICEEIAGRGHFLEERGIAEWPDGTISGRYAFRHALYQNVLSERIAEARRIRLHRLIGERLETGYGERTGEVAAELAVHFERGHEYRRAVQYYEQAGKNAIRRSAHREAIHHLTKGLELLETLPDTSERAQQELTLQITLGTPLIATKGYTAPEVERAYTRARELCLRGGDTSQLFPALWGLWAFYNGRTELQTAQQLAEQVLTVAKAHPDPVFLSEGYLASGISSFALGHFVTALQYLEQGLACYNPQRPSAQALLQAPGLEMVSCLSYAAWTLWPLGYPDQALQRAHEALALAQDTAHPFSLVYALDHLSVLHQLRREAPLIRDTAAATIKLCTEHGFSFYLAQAKISAGWVLAEEGAPEKGVAQMCEGLATRQRTGAQNYEPYFLALLAEAYGRGGNTAEGLRVIGKALEVIDKTDEHHYKAELHRLKGELTLQSQASLGQVAGKSRASHRQVQNKSKTSQNKSRTDPQSLTPDPQGEAEACFLKSLDVAREQQAKSWELRTTTSLARLWQRQGKIAEAHQMLSEIYGWFTEGFDTKDLQEAKALLEELSH